MARILMLAGVMLALTPMVRAQGELAQQAQAVLKTHCYRCHGEKGAGEGGLQALLDRRHLLARGLIVPGDPDTSRLLERVVKKEMPPPEEKMRPTPEEEAILRQWIKAGAAALQPPPRRTFVSRQAENERIWNDLDQLPEDERRSFRYLTLTHLYNAGVADDELEVYRQGLAKLVNSLSWSPRIKAPTAIDPERTIFRIDLRDYKWTKRTWGVISGSYPYSVQGNSAVEKNCRDATETNRFALRADWFAAYATVPEYYYQILELPPTAAEVRKLFGVSDEDERATGRVARSGFLGSRVSPVARLIERHESHFGAFWTATSFSERKQMFDEPLVRAAPTSATDTQQALFHLPNGMLAYMVWDASGRSLSTAKGLQDVRRSGASVQAPLSCMSCHTAGVIDKADEVQGHAVKAGLAKDVLEKIGVLYPSAKKLAAIAAEDSERFRKAAQKSGARLGSAEPIVALALRHEQNLDRAMAAAEFGFTPQQFAKKVASAKLSKHVSLADTGALKRQAFIENYAGLAQTLGLGQAAARITIGGATPVVFPEMLRPARGTPSGAAVAKIADPTKKGASTTAVMPAPATAPLANDLQVYNVREHLVCRFAAFAGDQYPVAMSPTERLLASECKLGVVAVFDPVTLEKRHELEAGKTAVGALAFSPDGKLIAAAAQDGTVKVWRATSGLLLATLAHPGNVSGLHFSANSKSLAVLGNQVSLWTVPGGQRTNLVQPKNVSGWTRALAIAPDHKAIAVVGKQLGLVDVANGKMRLLEGSGAQAVTAAFSPDGKWLASAGGVGRTISVWDLATGERKVELHGHTHFINALVFSPDSKLLVSGDGTTPLNRKTATGTPGEVKLWEIDIDSHWKTFEGHSRGVTNVVIGANGKLLASAGADGTVRVWSLDKDAPAVVRTAPFTPFEGHYGPIHSVVLSSDEKQVLTAGYDGSVRLWNATTGAEIKAIAAHAGKALAAAFASDGQSIFSVGEDSKLIQWDLAKGTALKKWELGPRIAHATFASDGKYVAISLYGGLVGQVNTTSGRMVRQVEGSGRGWAVALACAPGNRRIAISDTQRSVRIWDLDTQKVQYLRSLPKPGDANDDFHSLAFSPDGELLLSGSPLNKTAHLWDLKAGAEIHRVGPFTGFVSGVLFAPDGRSFFTSSGLVGSTKKKGSVSLQCAVTQIDVDSGQPMQYWDQLPAMPRQMLRTSDGKQLLLVVGEKLMRLSTENGKTVAVPSP